MSGETSAIPSGLTVDTLHWLLQNRFNDLNRLLDERYSTQTSALNAAVEAQQVAMRTALTAADTAVTAALTAAEKAVDKAEKSAEKRFDAVNEFREQLADQAATFMPRNESEVRMSGLADSSNAAITRNAERIREAELLIQAMPSASEWHVLQDSNQTAHMALTERITTLDRSVTERLSTSAGRSEGISASWLVLVAATGAIGMIITVIALFALHH